MKFEQILGIDISKNSLDLAYRDASGHIVTDKIKNNASSLRDFLKSLIKEGYKLSQVLICMEHTGIYCLPVLQVAEKMKLNLWLESSVQIKLSGGLQRGKSDKVDAIRIAEYAYRYQDKAVLWKPERKELQALKELNLARRRLVESIKMITTITKEKDFYTDKKTFTKHFKKTLSAMKEDLKSVEKEIIKCIKADQILSNQYSIIQSIQGVGPVVALNMILTTNEFTTITEAKKYACYAGVAPFEHTSGTSVRGRTRVSKRANMTMKSLLHMAALGAIKSNKDLRAYYERKVQEGKSKMLVINAVRNKLIHRIFSCIRENRKYDEIYVPTLG